MEHYKNTSLIDIEGEVWESIAEYDGLYEVSNMGRVKSFPRLVPIARGQRLTKLRILTQTLHYKSKTATLGLCDGGVPYRVLVSKLVADTFMRPRSEGEEICHKNKMPHDNRLKNLKIMQISDSKKVNYKLGIIKHNNGSKEKALDNLSIYGIFRDGKLVGKICKRCSSKCKIDYFYKNRNVCKCCDFKHMKEWRLKKQLAID